MTNFYISINHTFILCCCCCVTLLNSSITLGVIYQAANKMGIYPYIAKQKNIKLIANAREIERQNQTVKIRQ